MIKLYSKFLDLLEWVEKVILAFSIFIVPNPYPAPVNDSCLLAVRTLKLNRERTLLTK